MQTTSSLSILIVDDEKTNLDVLNHILSPDYDVFVAKSGRAALKQAATVRPDLILLDIMMPEMNGYEVLTHLQESEPTCRIPVIFITGLSGVDSEEKGLKMGAVDYIAKPFNVPVVKARVRSHMKIAEQIRAIESLGMLDPLTGLPNRRYFEIQYRIERLQAVREKTTVDMLLVELVGPMPDNYLIRKTALLLKGIQKALVNETRTVFLARVGHATFALFLIDADAAAPGAVVEMLRKHLHAAPFFADAMVHPVVSHEKDPIIPFLNAATMDLSEMVRGIAAQDG